MSQIDTKNFCSGNGKISFEMIHLPVIVFDEEGNAESIVCFFDFKVKININKKTHKNNDIYHTNCDNTHELKLHFDLLGTIKEKERELKKLNGWISSIIKNISSAHGSTDKMNILQIFNFITTFRSNMMNVFESKDPTKIKKFKTFIEYDYSF